MTCKVCGKEQRRPHRHGQGMPIRYGRFVAEQERAWIRQVFQAAKVRELRHERQACNSPPAML